MSRVYDNWERLVAAVLKKQQLWELCHQHSRTPSTCSEASESSSTSVNGVPYEFSSLQAFWLIIKIIDLDIENCFSRIDSFLGSVPKLLSTIWNSLGGNKTHVSDPSEPIRHNGYPELVEKMSISEINSVMSRLGMWCAMEDAENEHKNKFYGEDDFLTLFDEEEPSIEEIKESFDVFDLNKDGFIDCSELRRVFCALGFRQGCELEDCKRMIRDYDVNGDGLIDFREFVMFMEKCFTTA